MDNVYTRFALSSSKAHFRLAIAVMDLWYIFNASEKLSKLAFLTWVSHFGPTLYNDG